MDSSKRDAGLTVVAVLVLFLGLNLADNLLDPYTVRILNLIAINAILAVSLNLIYGFTGMFSLGHAGFMAVGAYTCVLFILSPEQKAEQWILEPIIPMLAEVTLPFFWAVLAGGILAAVAGLIIAIPVLRLGGDYLGIATLGFAEIIRVLIVNAPPLTNGALGIKGIPQYATIGWNYLWLAITVYVLVSLLKSNVGNIFRAIREDEIAARTMGINTFFYKVLSFTIGAFFAGIGGALLAALLSTIDPTMFRFLQTFNILMIVVAGGLGSVTGSIIGSVVITILLEWLRLVEDSTVIFGVFIPGIPGMRMVIFSMLLVGIIIFWRQGMLGTREFSWKGLFSLAGKIRNTFSKSQEGGK